MKKFQTEEQAKKAAVRTILKSIVVQTLIYSGFIAFALLDGQSVYWKRLLFIGCLYLWVVGIFMFIIALILAVVTSRKEYLEGLSKQIEEKDGEFANGLTYARTIASDSRTAFYRWMAKSEHMIFGVSTFVITGSKSLLISFFLYRISIHWAVTSIEKMMDEVSDVIDTKVKEHQTLLAEQKIAEEKALDEKLSNIGQKMIQEGDPLGDIVTDDVF